MARTEGYLVRKETVDGGGGYGGAWSWKGNCGKGGNEIDSLYLSLPPFNAPDMQCMRQAKMSGAKGGTRGQKYYGGRWRWEQRRVK